MRQYLRDIYRPSLEYDIQLLSVTHHNPSGIKGSSDGVPVELVAAVCQAGGSFQHDRPSLERYDELWRRLVLPRRI